MEKEHTDEIEITDEIAKRIKQLRINAGFTSYETFANQHNMSRKNYWRIESGGDIKMSTFLKIMKIHGVSLEDFFNDL